MIGFSGSLKRIHPAISHSSPTITEQKEASKLYNHPPNDKTFTKPPSLFRKDEVRTQFFKSTVYNFGSVLLTF